ncbi:AcrR family transcriptional regulator [Actinoplanes tereljensis]|uniref:TetR family transcriptional regulator n=1 Tax=Paractinoplanes tereljensis TaxID=571912 RepID=A0A919TXA6_9ACTN|nr:TetR/AcrR family transcriptional regulator [Actinoplanes tereljensis]GIF23707.1 TetR family transcriptional regulator [Actinoplanes tereljensis]
MNSEERRERILRKAAALFTVHGYAGVSMNDVLVAVGGSKGTLYRYFTDKTDLFRSTVEMLIDERNKPLRSFHPSDSDPAKALREFGRHSAAVVLEPGAIALHRLITAEAVRVEGLGQTFFQHGPAVGYTVLAHYLDTLTASGLVAIDDTMLAAAQLYHAMVGALQMRLLINADDRPTAAEIEASISAAVDTFLNGAGRG